MIQSGFKTIYNMKNSSLGRALSFAGLRDLPKSVSGDERFWIRAITLVKKKNNNEEYVISERRASGIVNHICDFGSMSPIGSVLRVHPYMYLDEGVRESCSRVSRDMLALEYPERADEIFASDANDLDIFRLQYAIDTQKNNINGYVEPDEVEADDIEGKEVMTTADEGVMVIEEVQALKPARKGRGRKKK